MKNLEIYCTTIKYYKVLDYLPNFIKPLGLGPEIYPSHWLDEKKGINITSLNRFYAEFTGFFWILKNRIKFMKKTDLIGNCHNRVLWLNDLYSNKQKLSQFSLYSKLLKKNNPIIYNNDVIQLQPITFYNTKKTLFEDFRICHDQKALDECLNFLPNDIKLGFIKHLNGFEIFHCNMFITNVRFFEEFCDVIFPWLEKCMEYCNQKKICFGYQSRIPAFLAERFTSYWFSTFKKRALLSYARLGEIHLSNKINKFVNTIKIPFTFAQYPTIHRY